MDFLEDLSVRYMYQEIGEASKLQFRCFGKLTWLQRGGGLIKENLPEVESFISE